MSGHILKLLEEMDLEHLGPHHFYIVENFGWLLSPAPSSRGAANNSSETNYNYMKRGCFLWGGRKLVSVPMQIASYAPCNIQV